MQQNPALINKRVWVSGGADSGSVLSMGNGRLLAYAYGPNIFKIQGPPYTSPSVAALNLAEVPGLTCTSSREVGAGIWHHELRLNGSVVGTLKDFVDAELPCLVRQVSLQQPLDFVLKMPHSAPAPVGRLVGVKAALLALIPPGTPVYSNMYVSPRTTAALFLASGQAGPTVESGEGGQWRIRCEAGDSMLAVVGGPEYPQCVEHAETLSKIPAAGLLERTRAAWWKFSSSRAALRLPEQLPLQQELRDAVDETAVIIKTQQSREGAVAAGYPFVMGYVRDQYGVSRGLLAMGLISEARGILAFYWGIFQHYGYLKNAQCIGLDGVFHRHENDLVEITGYLLIQAFDYLAASGDDAFVETIIPMLEWAWQAQVSQLVSGMLPFNGDETYIAGGILPRSILLDGSSEATLLFIEGGSRYLQWKRSHGHPSPACEAVLTDTRSRFHVNFWADGQLWANNLERVTHAPAPRFAHGVCLGDRKSDCRHFGWMEQGADGRYYCPRCLALQTHHPGVPERFFLPSIALTSLLVGSDLVTPEQNRGMLDTTIRRFEQTGALVPSKSGRVPGYESGVLLNALVMLDHPAAQALYRLCIAQRDDTGAWVEYYNGQTPSGTRYRPWESALNLVGVLAFAQAVGKRKRN